jgi:hypothetical protein
MNLTKRLSNLLGLCILTAIISACSSGGSSHTATGDATTLPFGAEEITSEIDYDGDGNWDARTTYSIVYNDKLQVTEITTLREYDENADGIPDSSTVETITYDPDITAEEIMIKSVAKASRPSMDSTGLGAIISRTYEQYAYDETSGQVAAYPGSTREYLYSYTAEGILLSYSYTSSKINTSDGTPLNTYTDVTTFTYDENGNQIVYSYQSVDDSDGDGIFDSGSSDTCTSEYDSNGYLTSRNCISTNDSDGAGPVEPVVESTTTTTYTHTYTDGLLTRTDIEGTNDSPSTMEFTYNNSGLLATKTKYYTSGPDTYYYYLTFGYDASDRVNSLSYRSDEDYSSDESIDYRYESLYTFTYGENGLVSQETYEYRYDNSPGFPGYTSHDYDTYSYEYTDNNLIASYQSNSFFDADLDGTMDGSDETRSYEFTYDNGFVVSSNYDWVYTGSDGIIDAEDHESRLATYENGLLKSMTWEEDSDDDGTVDDATTIEVTYNTSGQVVAYEANNYTGDYETLDSAQTVSVTYNADNTVTGTITEIDYSDVEPQPEVTQFNLDFSANGIPSGGTAYFIGQVNVERCESPSIKNFLDSSPYSFIEEDRYPITTNIPKVLGVIWIVAMGSQD